MEIIDFVAKDFVGVDVPRELHETSRKARAKIAVVAFMYSIPSSKAIPAAHSPHFCSLRIVQIFIECHLALMRWLSKSILKRFAEYNDLTGRNSFLC